MKKILVKKIPLYFLFIATGLLLLIIYHMSNTAPQAKMEIQQAIAPAMGTTKTEMVRLKDYSLISPLLMADEQSESENLKELKRNLSFEINQLKMNGTINDASVYVRSLNNGDWTSVNNNTEYAPGSVIKIATLITFLKMCEKDPALFSKQFYATERIRNVPPQTFEDAPLLPNKYYNAKELLRRMIVYSDNRATLIINEAMDISIFKKLFTDLGIAEPDVHDPHFMMHVSDLSKFLNILYNATYLDKNYSVFALSLLSESSFTKGIVSGIPADVKVAHKFGETGNPHEAQLHETAIVYLGNDPYLITIMTKGRDVQRLPEALSGLSKIAYEKMKI